MPTDSRPVISTDTAGVSRVSGRRCHSCDEVAAFAWPRCPACGGPVDDAEFGPEGTVWSATVVRVPVPGRTPPYALAYVDLDGGPRILAHADEAIPIGARVRLTESADGDVRVEVLT